jgi:hypothetical protein
VAITSSNQGDKKLNDNKQLREEYRRNIKDKSYSRSIDTNIQKFNHINAIVSSTANTNTDNVSLIHNQLAQQHPQETLTNTIKPGKKK